MKKRIFRLLVHFCIIFALAAGLAGAGTNTSAASKSTIALSVRWNKTLQTVDGFGGSWAFRKSEGILRLKEPVRSQLLDMVFSQEKGIGISILRLMIGDEGGGSADIIEPQKGVFVWDDPAWDKKKADFDRGQIWLANEAKKRGVTTILASAWSPPAWMKTNNSYNGNGTGELKPECYQDYADYLAEYVLGYKKHFGLDIQYLSMQNEPDIAPEYPGCLWSAENISKFIRENLGPTFKARGVKAKIVIPENVNFSESMAAAIMSNPQTAAYVDVIATHAYGLGYTVPEFTEMKATGKPIWQTEYMGSDNRDYKSNTISDGLRYAGLMGEMFRTTPLNAYFWWWPAANNGADGSDLIRLCTDGADGTATENGLFRVFKRYYAFGNYSRFIRPGYRMVRTEGDAPDYLLVTSYKDPKTGNFSIVAVNKNQDAVNITLKLDGFPAGTTTLVPYRTSAGENLKKLQPVKVVNNTVSVELKGQSVTTFMPGKYALKPLADQKNVFSTLEAEENDGMTRGLKTAAGPGDGKMVVNLRNGNYIKYGSMNFGDGSARGDLKAVLYMNARVAALQDGIIEVRLDDPVKGKVVGKMEVYKIEGGSEWSTVSAVINTKAPGGARGVHDLYLVCKGAKGDLVHIDYFGFSDIEE
jgi:glucuronoarabinoxylan endo-1,4-beta-xylanase